MMRILLLTAFLVWAAFTNAQSVIKSMLRLPDTGANQSYTTTFGEDNDYNINIPFFIDHKNGTLTDTVTGLMWQKTDGGEMTIENAIIYCDSLTLGGFNDWRLPTPLEAFSILNYQNSNPAINTLIFTKTLVEYWWTNTLQYNDKTKIWCTNSGGGIGNHPKLETISGGGTKHFHVLAVRDRSTPKTIETRFFDNSNGTITDNLTNLIWQKTPNTNALTWEQALLYAEDLTISGINEWRLPNIKELQSITDFTVSNPAVNTTFFSITGTKKFWSSTSLPNQATKAWYWDTQFGITTYDLKTIPNYVLCVSSKPSFLTVLNGSTQHKNEVMVYPNPAKSQFQILNKQGATLELLNQNGQLEFSAEITNDAFIVDIRTLPSGIYIVKTSSDQAVNINKIIKEL